MKYHFRLLDFVIGLLFTFFLISLGVFAAVQLRPLYYMDIDILHIPETSGFSKETILENYNALIDYCSPFYFGSLQFPSLPASASGLSHFDEVKRIFNFFFYGGLSSLLVLLPLCHAKRKAGQADYLLTGALTAVLLPLGTGLACAINFNKTFVLFHRIFFRNNDWMFDPATDPVILILPEAFFLHCALVIVGVVITGSILLLLLYIRARRRLASQDGSTLQRRTARVP